MTIKPITLRPVEPIGTVENPAFVDYVDGTGELKMVTSNIYPPGQWQEMRDRRIRAGLGLRAACERLGMKAVDVCNLENGRAEPVDGWDEVWRRLEAEST